MKLKTLKDIEKHCMYCMAGCDGPHSCKRNECVYIDNLKKEAIKWVKFFTKNNLMITYDDWMDFFNITEEDLK